MRRIMNPHMKQEASRTRLSAQQVILMLYDDDDYPIPAKQLRQKNIATHELGHALGFAGHASEANIDVMYFEVRAVIYLSIRDLEQVLQIWEYYTN